MKIKNKKIIFLVICIAAVMTVYAFKCSSNNNAELTTKEIRPERRDIESTVSTTGTVQPRNRLEIKPSVAGRMDKILVVEGDRVRSGQVLAYMSSTDRASLIDAARAQGSQALKYWEEAYKPVPIIAPISGTLIVRSVEPGQTVTTATAILVISDRLIVKASVDETDIGRVTIGQKASVSLDSHPEISVQGKVTHISYESTTVNNVTTYYVEIQIDKIPAVFRSGMSANILITDKIVRNALVVPADAVSNDKSGSFVMIRSPDGRASERKNVVTGLNSDGYVEIRSGISDADVLLSVSKTFALPENKGEKNMFMPSGKSPRKVNR